MTSQNYDTGHDHKPIDPLVITVHQEQYREYEIHHEHGKKRQVIVLDACYKVGNFLWDIGIPY